MADRNRLHSKQQQHQSTTMRVLLVGERKLIVESLEGLFSNEGMVVTRCAPAEAVVTAGRTLPNVIVAELPGSDAADLGSIRDLANTGVPVVGVSMTADPIEEALWIAAGAQGVAGPTASFETLREYVQRAAHGCEVLPLDRRYWLEDVLRTHRRETRRLHGPFTELTARERAIFAAVYEGLSADQIAEETCVSVSTVRSHIRSILAKLNVHSQLAAVALARTSGWFDSVPSTSGSANS